MASASTSSVKQGILGQSFGVQWRKALVSLPRLVPLAALKYTSSEGPHPFILNLTSRGKYLIPVYVFVPPNPEPEHSAHGLPVVIDFHGGGFVLGSCFEQGPFCAKLARDLGAVVLCVDYRMGPIDTFPAALEDAEDVLSAVLDINARGGKELREAISSRLSVNAKKAMKKARKMEKKQARALRKAQRKDAKADRKEAKRGSKELKKDGGLGSRLRPTLSRNLSSMSRLQPALSRTNTDSSTTSKGSPNDSTLDISRTNSGVIPTLSRTNTNMSTGSNSSTDDMALPASAIIDTTRVALSGFSSGGNVILNLALSISPSIETKPVVPGNWPSRFPASYPSKIPLLLYYPSFDVRQLPGERPCPKGLEPGGGFWSEANDLLMPTYLPRDWAAHPRASPGLTDLGPPPPPDYRPSSSKTPSATSSRAPSPSRVPTSAPTSGPTSKSTNSTAEARAITSAAALKASEAAGAATVRRPKASSIKNNSSNNHIDNIPPPGLHPQAKMQLVLPVLDTLSEQSELWIRKVADTGRTVYEWNYEMPAPGTASVATKDPSTTRTAATKAASAVVGANDGTSAAKPQGVSEPHGADPATTFPSTAKAAATAPTGVSAPYTGPATGSDLEVLRYSGQKHGWTQMPEGWLDAEARKTRLDAFEKSIAFVRRLWDERERSEMEEAIREVEDEERLVCGVSSLGFDGERSGDEKIERMEG